MPELRLAADKHKTMTTSLLRRCWHATGWHRASPTHDSDGPQLRKVLATLRDRTVFLAFFRLRGIELHSLAIKSA